MLFCIWGPHKFSIFGESGSSSRLMTQASFIATCLLNANRLPKHSCAFQSQHLLSRCIYCSRYLSCARRYSTEYFSPYAPPRSLREPLLQLRCHHLALATQLALAQKSTFLKIPISFTPLIPCPLPPTEEREKTERTTAQLLASKKCFLLRFAPSHHLVKLLRFPHKYLCIPRHLSCARR